MSGIALNSGHALLRGWVTPGYPVVYTAVHRNPDGVPQSWLSPSLHIGTGPQSSTAAATYAGADVAPVSAGRRPFGNCRSVGHSATRHNCRSVDLDYTHSRQGMRRLMWKVERPSVTIGTVWRKL